jgi:predicted RNase H-like HicB family nuclease
MDYVIVIHTVIHTAEEGGYRAAFPALDGCFVQGESIDEVLRDAPEAIASHPEALEEFGDSPPRRETVMITTVLAPSAA